MYDELVKVLRETDFSYGCPCEAEPLCKDKDCVIIQAAEAIEELQRRAKVLEKVADKWCEAVPKWIPVTERLPEDNEAVNVVWVNHNPVFYYQHIKDKPQTSTGVYYRGQWYWWSAVAQDYLAEYGKWEPDLMDAAIEVTHWMPLPEPPKEETK